MKRLPKCTELYRGMNYAVVLCRTGGWYSALAEFRFKYDAEEYRTRLNDERARVVRLAELPSYAKMVVEVRR